MNKYGYSASAHVSLPYPLYYCTGMTEKQPKVRICHYGSCDRVGLINWVYGDEDKPFVQPRFFFGC